MLIRRILAKWLFVTAVLVSGASAVAAPDLFSLASAQKDAPAPKTVTADIISSASEVKANGNFDIAITLEHEFGWHTYWINPGTSGKPTSIEWKLPTGWTIQGLGWPTPEKEQKGPIASFVYSGQTVLPFRVSVPAKEKIGETRNITAHVEWLACNEICVPGETDLSLSVTVEEQTKASDEAPLIEGSKNLIPKTVADPGKVTAVYEENRLRIDIDKTIGKVEERIEAFVENRDLLDYENEPVRLEEKDFFSLYFKTTQLFQNSPPKNLKVVIVADNPRTGGWAAQTEIPLQSGSVSQISFLSMEENRATSFWALSPASLSAISFAFLGGLILNLMPCVFPVLSLKILQLVGSGRRESTLWIHGLAFTLGILLSMLAVSGTLIGLRSAGDAVGWGFQLQSAWVVAILAVLFFSITLNLLGVFEFTAGSQLANAEVVRTLPANGLLGSLCTGVLAVVVASPCTAPFMGAALGYAVTQSALDAVLIFLSLGFGMALPWLLLTIVPFWARCLPRPGAWMVTLRRILAVPMALAVLWLLWVLSHQVDFYGIITVVIAGGALSVLLWAIGRAQYGRSSSAVLKAVSAGLTAACIGLIATGIFSSSQTSPPGGWERWSEQEITDALEHKTPIVVEYTAAWCVTCQFNKVTAIRTKDAEAAMARLGYLKFVADWTNRVEEITRSLASFGRSGVPLYVLYNGKTGQATVLPELLTEAQFIEALELNAEN